LPRPCTGKARRLRFTFQTEKI
jgi:hypothetical protein